jgi:dTDP-4-dehydrorhamnose reductase
MVGRALRQHCESFGDEILAFDHASLDISNPPLVELEVHRQTPDAIINCAAWTDVDGCQREPQRSEAANADGPKNLAKAADAVKAAFVTISTDYVFDGYKPEGFYTQDDSPNPISVYGQSKLRGEQQSQLVNPRAIIVRSGFIFGPGGKNFLSMIPGPLSRSEPVKAISDAWGTPTYAIDLAKRLRELCELNEPGIYHVVNEGPGVSYEEFAQAVAGEVGHDKSLVQGILSESLTRPAPRPRNSRMKCLISAERGLEPLPFWRDALRAHLRSSGLGPSGH